MTTAQKQTATVTFDPSLTAATTARALGTRHICDPLMEEGGPPAPADHAAMERVEGPHGHGGHAGMSMDSMAREMRNRFLLAPVFTVPIIMSSQRRFSEAPAASTGRCRSLASPSSTILCRRTSERSEGGPIENVLLGAALLACPVGMGVMLWFMAKGMRHGAKESPGESSIEELRAEHRRLGQDIEQLERPPVDDDLSRAAR